ncbi:c-type cytochrome biogenesis protein CcmI [Salinispirillum sp. LH 10-3-1]|uniref:C-type cytochrome biogenesis protein CcmI n=1 Tax=Salinispirillum sp. LH 10-3-1 TaxID=2952525 RepID=A0AB38YCB0_9GAMM
MFAMLLVLTALLAVVLAYPALYGSSREITLARNADRVQAYELRRSELEAELNAGVIDDEQFQSLSLELDKQLLSETEVATETMKARGRLNWKWSLAATILVAVSAAALYVPLGAQQEIALYEKAQVRDRSEADFMAFMGAYESYVLGKSSATAEDWFMLADTYTQAGRFPEAIDAYDRVEERYRARGEFDPDDLSIILTSRGQLHFFLAGQMWNESVERDFREAIRLNPENIQALGTLGVAYFASGEYQQAIDVWQMFADLVPEGSGRETVIGGIRAAQERLGQEPDFEVAERTPHRVDVVFTPLPIDVNLQSVVFVLARPVGGGVPIAVQRFRVDQMPSRLTLTDNDRMSDDARLSDYEEVEVTAFVSPGGNADLGQATHEAPMIRVATLGDDTSVLLSFTAIGR